MHWLKVLVKEQGGPKNVGQAVGTPDTHITAMAKGNRGIGDEMADRLERRFGKENGWMDRPTDAEEKVIEEPSIEQFVTKLATYLSGLPEDQAIQASQSLAALASHPDSNRAVERVTTLLSTSLRSPDSTDQRPPKDKTPVDIAPPGIRPK